MSNKGYLLVMMQAPPAFEDEFNAWYDTEHIPERVAVPGFETGIRYVCVNGSPRFLAMYDMESPEVLNSPAYLSVSFEQASPWTKRVTSRVKVTRFAGQQIYPGHQITGPASRVMVLRLFDGVVNPGRIDTCRSRLHLHLTPVDPRLVVQKLGGQPLAYASPIEPQGVSGHGHQHGPHSKVKPTGFAQHGHAGIDHGPARAG